MRGILDGLNGVPGTGGPPRFLNRLGDPRAAWLAANLLTAAAYFALGCVVSGFFGAYGLFPAPIWLPAAVATIAAIAGEVRLLPGIFVGSLLTNAVLFAPPLSVTLIISLTNALGPVAGAIALRWWRPAAGLFTSFAGVIRFIACTTLLSPAISATGGAVAMSLGAPLDAAEAYSVWVGWWLCDSSGTLYLAPALLLWLGDEREPEADLPAAAARIDRHNFWVWAAVAAASAVLFLTPPLRGSDIRAAAPFLLVVPLSWVALRMSLRSAYTLVSLVAIVAAGGTVAGFGPFHDHGLANPLQLVGVLVVVLAMTVLTIVALVSELREAQRDSRVKAMFLAKTSHELRTPLNAILGFAEMIDRQAAGPVADAKCAGYARIIHSAGEHLLSLINDLIDLSKIEAGRFTLSETAVTLGEAIDDTADLVAVPAQAKSIALVTAVARGLGTVTADPKALRQILINLASNAVKFTPSGGRVEIAAERGAAGDLVIQVSDSGVGIPADALERVFDPFERVEDGTAPAVEGNGLGLSITRGLVELHGGTIRLDSILGRGTTATVTLPAWRILAAAPPPHFAEAAE